MANPIKMKFNVLFKKEGNLWTGHCLELDIVTESTILKDVRRDMGRLIVAQVEYAFSNDNLKNLYHPAPAKVWGEFERCKEAHERRIKVHKKTTRKNPLLIPPPHVFANERTCQPAL